MQQKGHQKDGETSAQVENGDQGKGKEKEITAEVDYEAVAKNSEDKGKERADEVGMEISAEFGKESSTEVGMEGSERTGNVTDKLELPPTSIVSRDASATPADLPSLPESAPSEPKEHVQITATQSPVQPDVPMQVDRPAPQDDADVMAMDAATPLETAAKAEGSNNDMDIVEVHPLTTSPPVADVQPMEVEETNAEPSPKATSPVQSAEPVSEVTIELMEVDQGAFTSNLFEVCWADILA